VGEKEHRMSFRERYGPWALIAGASDGIGEAFARGIAERGVNVLLLARREELLSHLAEQIRAEHGVDARPLVADLTAADLDARVEAGTRGLEVGLLVYNAGAVHGVGAFHEQPLEHAQKLVALNCTGPLLLTHRLGGAMRTRGRGGIVLVTSMVALAGSAHVATYAATKAFELHLTEAIAEELRGTGVRAVAVCPGPTRTEFSLVTGGSPGRGAIPLDDAGMVVRATWRALASGRRRAATGPVSRASMLASRILPRGLVLRAAALAHRPPRALKGSEGPT
jgi:short-subunit dehydrogenase